MILVFLFLFFLEGNVLKGYIGIPLFAFKSESFCQLTVFQKLRYNIIF